MAHPRLTSTISKSQAPVWEYSVSDGDLIIVLPTEQYRVYSDEIEMHSKKLARVLLTTPEVDGCTVLRLSSLSEDWDAVMPIIINPLKALSSDVLLISTLFSIVRLHNLYDMPILRAHADADLQKVFPYGFDEWRSHHHHVYRSEVERGHTCGYEFQSIINVLNPELFEDGRKYLPSALYLCLCQRTMIEITKGYDEPDGPVIPVEMREMLMKGAAALSKECSRRRYKWWVLRNDKVQTKCQSPALCHKVVRRTVESIIEASEEQRIQDALYSISDVIRHSWDLCEECRNDASQAAVEAAQAIFNDLPVYFGLPPWGQLLGTTSA